MWGGSGTAKYEKIDSFFIDKDQKRIVLIGVGNFKEIEDHRHYSILDSSGRLIKIFELAEKSGDANFAMYSPETRGSEVTGGFWIGFKKQNLSLEDLKFAKEEELTEGKNKEFLGRPCRFDNDDKKRKDSYKWPLAQTTRYPSSQEQVKNLCSYEKPEYKQVPYEIFDKNGKYLKTLKEPKLKLVSQPQPKSSNNPDCIPIISFDQPWQGVIWDRFTVKDKAIRVALTPFALVADILLTPLYIIGVIGMGVGGK